MANKVDNEEINIDISYVGAPRYRIHVIAPDYKKAEGVLKRQHNRLSISLKKQVESGEFHRYSEQKSDLNIINNLQLWYPR